MTVSGCNKKKTKPDDFPCWNSSTYNHSKKTKQSNIQSAHIWIEHKNKSLFLRFTRFIFMARMHLVFVFFSLAIVNNRKEKRRRENFEPLKKKMNWTQWYWRNQYIVNTKLLQPKISCPRSFFFYTKNVKAKSKLLYNKRTVYTYTIIK